MSENVGASTSHNRKGLHGMYRDNFTLGFTFISNIELGIFVHLIEIHIVSDTVITDGV
jgi:hypothetical protein